MIVYAVMAMFGGTVVLMLMRGQGDSRPARIAVVPLLGVAVLGYALTGRPELPAAPATATSFDSASQSAFETARIGRLQRFGEVGAWLTFTDAMIRFGATDFAVRALQDVIADHQGNADLWIGLGNALAMHGGGVNDAARLAFARAQQISPGSPHPAFFLGLARLETGDARGAVQTWHNLARRLPPDADLDRWIAVADARAAGQPD